MSKNHKKLYISLSIILLFFVFLIITSTTPSKPQVEIPPLLDEGGVKGGNFLKSETRLVKPAIEEQLTALKNTENITLILGEEIINLSFAPETFFYDALMEASNAGNLTFEGKNYPGLGFFITDIGPLHSGNGKYLLYYINGKEATVGVSAYKLKNGDIIEWKLE